MKSWLALLLVLAAASTSAQQRTRLPVYTTLEVANIADFKKAFQAASRDGAPLRSGDRVGGVRHRFLAEKKARRGGVIGGLAAPRTMHLRERGRLELYAPATLAPLKPSFRGRVDPPAYVGMEGWVA